MTARLHAIFHKLVSGDDALLRLAQRVFDGSGLLPEFNPRSLDDLTALMKFRPRPDAPFVIHLPRSLKLSEARDRERVAEFARRSVGQASGMVVHDEGRIATHPEDYLAAVRHMNALLPPDGPMLYIEYAVGLPVEAFVGVFEGTRDLGRVSACVDISHVGIRQCQRAYEKMFPGEDVCHLKANSPRLRERVAEVQAACDTATPVTAGVVAAIAAIGKPMHFHLHDGHPASTFSQFGVSDHLSFFDTLFR